ncbi:DNA repair protein RecN [Bombilactobacillus thymidiniphilus]|uniref:DNA repair protein RecN n=1 Tax=Bombilactobacillus thymidiniphilus TaxID=2923363 RepID=A0ABY4PCQ9_9LACO|nr:DNA repair protein RecN [Bombilactobacillus thymidiniphilus]UQS83453.1 DNA repair protein RecN [Bombilactobacillus thymidiniphilus]
MLQELIIQDFAIIEKIDVNFENGLTALTGETGAGKSIIIDALGLLVGTRGLSEYVRTQSQKAVVQGMFTIDTVNQATISGLCQDLGLDFSDNTLIVKRELHKNGRNVCRINDQLVSVATLRRLGRYLIDLSGQNQSQRLLDPATHLELLDQFGHQQINPLLKTYQTTYATYCSLKKQLTQVQTNARQRAQEIDMLQFQVQEITAAHLQPDEEERLQAQQLQLANFEKINQVLQTIYNELGGNDGNLVERLGQLVKQMQSISEFASVYASLASQLSGAYYDLQDSQDQILQQLDEQDFDSQQLEEVEQRLQLINNLEKKYGATLPEVLAFGQAAQQRLQTLQQQIQDPKVLQQQLESVQKDLAQQAVALTEQRQKVAHQLTALILQQLKSMYMDKTLFEVHFTPQDYTNMGNQAVEFYLQTNPGEDFKPLAKIASGGELARIMLALKTILAQYQHVETLVFDEIDTGVSGRVAQAIGDQMRQLADQMQVLCITHLPQVAADSQQQYLVQKKVVGQKTQTQVIPLDQKQRVEVIAQMLEGTKVTALTRQHAQELLRLAQH